MENFVPRMRKVLWFFMMIACSYSGVVTTCGLGIRSGIIYGVWRLVKCGVRGCWPLVYVGKL